MVSYVILMKNNRFNIIYNKSKDNYLFLDFKNREELSHSQVFSLLNTWDKVLTDLESVFNKEIYTCGDLFDPDAPVEVKTRTFYDTFHIQQVEIERLNIELEIYKSSYGKFKEKVDEILGTDIAIPPRLAAFMKGRKSSVEMSREFDDFKAFLLKE